MHAGILALLAVMFAVITMVGGWKVAGRRELIGTALFAVGYAGLLAAPMLFLLARSGLAI